MKSSRLMYSLIFWLYIFNGILPLLILFGFEWLTNISMYMMYFDLDVRINIIYILVKFTLIITTILMIKALNKRIKAETKIADENLEDNPTIPKYYERYRVDYLSLIPLFVNFTLALISFFGIGKNINKYIIFIVLVGFGEICYSFFILYNKIKYQEFFVKQKE